MCGGRLCACVRVCVSLLNTILNHLRARAHHPRWLLTQPEKVVGIATHSAFLLTTVFAVLDCDEAARSWFATGELRRLAIWKP